MHVNKVKFTIVAVTMARNLFHYSLSLLFTSKFIYLNLGIQYEYQKCEQYFRVDFAFN